MVVGKVMDLDVVGKALPDSFYAQRVYWLVESGKPAAEGRSGICGFVR